MKIIPGKWYAVDMFPGGPFDPPRPFAGPFDTKEEAEKECDNNIAGDCFVDQCPEARKDQHGSI